ncbi:MAG TPA: WD40 repeat domain-containing serine/threonine-protein kinase, partial [Ktedonobacteraceae bacterium]|nr:WD40 repeat domain-containing serine/threonine-protein kinase [Ktedonobacteraceae bacterium]
MTLSASFFCDICGAANRPQAQFCRACGQSLRPSPHSMSTTITGLLAPQAMLKQRYMIYGQAGRGGFGAVYKAADTEFGNRLVAVKEMSQSNLEPQELEAATESFKHEALLLAGLTHPNLPRIYEQFMENGRSYLVMDFIEGETLEQHLHKLAGQKLPPEKVFDIALQLCSVLEYLHTRQPPIIFRDLKPANIMITPSGHIYLIDFGIARHFKPGQEKDTVALGSSGYAPPEQYGKSQTTLRADIYSLGATLHQLLSGDDPSESPFHFAPLHLTDPALAGLDTLIMSMVSVNVDQRPASITLVQQELLRIATQYKLSSSGGLSQTLPPLPARTLPPNYQAPGTPAATRKRAPKGTSQPQIYPQVNTLYVCMGHTGRITTLAWSPNGKYLVSASYDKTIQVWDGAKGGHIRTYTGHSAHVNALAWAPNGTYLASASDDRSVRIWDPTTGTTISTYTGHKAAVATVSWSPDGTYIASAGDDRTVQIWHAQTHELLRTYTEHQEKVYVTAWSPDGRYLASAGKDHVVKIWEPRQGEQKRSFWRHLLTPHSEQRTLSGYDGTIYALAWTPDSKRIATASNYRVRVRDIHSGFYTFTPTLDSNTIKNTLSWSPNGKHLAVGGNDKIVHVWNVVNKQEILTYFGHTGYVIAVAWSPDGTRMASAGVDRTIQ